MLKVRLALPHALLAPALLLFAVAMANAQAPADKTQTPNAAPGQSQVNDRQVRLVVPGELDRLGDGAGDAAYLVAGFDEHLFGHVGDHQIVFGNQHF